MSTRKVLSRVAVVVTGALIGTFLVTVRNADPVSADVVAEARGYAYGASESAVAEPNPRAPEVEAVVPPPADQEQNQTQRARDELLNVLFGLVSVASVEADACVENGVSAKLQREINIARIKARGEEPADDDNDENEGPNDDDPERGVVTPDVGFVDGCVQPGRVTPRGQPSPTGTATGSPTASPTGSPTASPTGSPTASPTASPTGGFSPSPTGTASEPPPPDCEDADTDPASEDFTGPHCVTNLPLWHGRGFARAISEPLGGDDILAEAVARCENGREIFATGAAFPGLSSLLNGDPSQPNQQLDLSPIISGAVATFWETNWDPKTNSTTDGSDTVWVNGLHITTPVDDIILSHAEASADCPAAPVPAGGFPRDITLTPSKGTVLFSKTFTLAGVVTPATEFQTPRNCVEGVTVTIRRDIVGGNQNFVDVGSVVTDNRGHFTFNYKADRNAQWLAFIDKNNPADCALSASTARAVLVKPFVKLRISQQNIRRGRTVRLTTIVDPCQNHVGTRIKLKRQYGSSMVEEDTKRLDADCRAVFLVQANYRSAVYQAAWPKQDEDHQTGKSRRKVVRTR